MNVTVHPFLFAAIEFIDNDLLVQQSGLNKLPRQHRFFLIFSRLRHLNLATTEPGTEMRWVPAGKFERFVDSLEHDLEDDSLDVRRPDNRSGLVSRFIELLATYSKAALAEMSEIAVFEMAV